MAPAREVPVLEAPVRGRQARAVPRCVAGELVSLARTSAGVDPEFALARRADGGLVAFLSRSSAGARVLSMLALDAQGRPVGAPRELSGAIDPSAPALVASATGYVLAFRDRTASSDAPAARVRERLIVAALGPDGALLPWPGARSAIAQGQPLAGTLALDAPAEQPGWGPVALGASGDRVGLLAARGRAGTFEAHAEGSAPPASLLRVEDVLRAGVERVIPIPDGAAVVAWDRAPALLVRPDGLAWALEGRASGGRALFAQFNDDAPSWLADGVGAPSALSLEDRALLGYVSAGPDGATIRVRPLDARGPSAEHGPSTVGVYGPALDPQVGLARLGPDTVAAITLSHMADDATGSLNLSLTDARGAFVGRYAALASIRLRRARVAVAAPPAADGSAWALLDGRADDGAPVLGAVAVRCDLAQEASAQGLPSATMMQESAAPDEPPFSADRPGSLAQCAPRGAPAVLATHSPEGEDATAGVSWRSVALRDGRVVLFARRRAAGGQSEWIAAAGAEGTVVARGALPADDRGELLDAAEVSTNESYALTAGGALLRLRAAGSIERASAGLPEAWSARFVRGGSGIVSATRVGSGVRFAYVPIVRGRAAAAVPLTVPLEGHANYAVLDAVSEGSTVHALLGRRGDGALARALVSFDASPRPRANGPTATDPFTDPLSIGGDGGALLAQAGALRALWQDRGTLRIGLARSGTLSDVHSLFGYLPGGGATLSVRHGHGPAALVIAARPGASTADAEPSPARFAVTVHGADGAIRALSLRTPEDASAIPTGAEAHEINGGVALVYTRARAQGALEWLVQRASCAQGQGGSR